MHQFGAICRRCVKSWRQSNNFYWRKALVNQNGPMPMVILPRCWWWMPWRLAWWMRGRGSCSRPSHDLPCWWACSWKVSGLVRHCGQPSLFYSQDVRVRGENVTCHCLAQNGVNGDLITPQELNAANLIHRFSFNRGFDWKTAGKLFLKLIPSDPFVADLRKIFWHWIGSLSFIYWWTQSGVLLCVI